MQIYTLSSCSMPDSQSATLNFTRWGACSDFLWNFMCAQGGNGNIPGESYSCSLSKSGRTVQICSNHGWKPFLHVIIILSSRSLLECLGPKVILKCFECSLYDEFNGRPVHKKWQLRQQDITSELPVPSGLSLISRMRHGGLIIIRVRYLGWYLRILKLLMITKVLASMLNF